MNRKEIQVEDNSAHVTGVVTNMDKVTQTSQSEEEGSQDSAPQK